MLRKKKFLIGILVVLLAMGFLVYNGFAGGAAYYYEVSELLAKGNSIYGETVRVNGLVTPGSLIQEAQGTKLTFTVSDNKGNGSIKVVYQGVVPDSFKVGNELTAEGRLNADGVFEAQTLMPKCPSKYDPV